MQSVDRQSTIRRYKALGNLIDAATEGVQVDYRRREDLAAAVAASAESVWSAIAENESAAKNAKGMSMAWFPIAFIATGGFLHWWLSPDEGFWDFNFGTYLILTGVFFVIGSERSRISRDAQTRALREQQDHLRLRWRESGATDAAFWDLRNLHKRQEALFNTPVASDPDSDAHSKIGAQLETDREALWQQVREDHFERASGQCLLNTLPND